MRTAAGVKPAAVRIRKDKRREPVKIRILAAGRIKELFYRDALAEYVKRLHRYAQVEICEVPDEKTPEGASRTEEERILAKEGARLLKKIRIKDYVIALAIKGTEMDSPGFAGHIEALMNAGSSTLTFVIGGSLGLSPEVLTRADESISFSRLTFPHQLMRVILCEQLYRAFRIINREPYHK